MSTFHPIDFQRELAEARAQRVAAVSSSAELATTRETVYEPLWRRMSERRLQNGFGEDFEIATTLRRNPHAPGDAG